MASWLQNQIKVAEGLLEAVDRTAKQASKKEQQEFVRGGREGSADSTSTTGRRNPLFQERSSPAKGSDDTNLARRPGIASPAARLSPTASSSQPAPELLSSQGCFNGSKRPAASPLSPQPGEAGSAEQPTSLASLFGASSSSSLQPPAQSPQERLTASAAVTPNRTELAAEPTSTPAVPSQGSDSQGTGAAVPGNGHKVADSPAGQQAPPHVHLKPSSEQALPTASDVASPVSMQEPSLAPQAAESYSAPPSLSQQPKETLASQASSSPVNTADAVAEAIKAAAAVTGGSDGSEDVDGPMDSRVREMRLAKMVENLKRRLEQLKSENEQLEELLRQADARVSGRAGDIGRLEDALAAARLAESSARAELMEAERTKQAEVSSLSSALETARSRTAELQARLLAVEEDNEKLLQERQLSEALMLTALREEVAAMERRLEDERFAAASARQSFAAREQELEATLAESAATLTNQQRAVEEKARRLTTAENRAAASEAEATRLRSQLEATEEQLSRQGTDAAAASPARESQFLELQERAASLQAALSNSESQRQGLEVELNGLRNDLDSLRSQAANTVHPLEVEQRLREVTDLLYQKQSQIEKMAAERSARQMAWERDLASVREDAERVKRQRVRTDRAATYVDGELVVPMEDMGDTYQKLANDKRVGKAVKAGAKLLDATTLTAVRFLRRYPLGRLAVFAYVVFIHLFLWLLLHHLQQRAMHVEPKLGLHLQDNNP